MTKTPDLADRIAESLLTNGFDQRAHRLVLEAEDVDIRHGDLGGWCKGAVADIARRELAADADLQQIRRAMMYALCMASPAGLACVRLKKAIAVLDRMMGR